MNRSIVLTAVLAVVLADIAAAQQSLTPPGMPALRPVQERPTEVPREEAQSDGSDVRDESGSLSFSPPAMSTGARGDPSSTPPPSVVTTRPVNPNQEMPPLNVRSDSSERQAPRMTATPAEGSRPAPGSDRQASPGDRPTNHASAPRTSERDEIARLDAEVAAARARLPAGPAPTGVGGGQIPPSEMTVKPGVPVVFNIARQHLNRIVTPYASPFVKTTTEGTTATVEGRIVYIASNNPGPVSLFIGDESDPVNAVAVTVVPRDIPAVQVTLRVEGYEPSVARPMNPGAAEQFELSQPFLQTIREIFRALALGEVPSGYGMAPIRGAHPMMPDCPMTGVRFRPMQEVAGSQMLVLVAKAENVGKIPVSLNEEMCASDHVVAVAAWPRRELLPGQATEVFIALRRPVERASNVRPSVLMGN